jgi:eukaryotic-like serine/threonine-protein kinase
MEQHHLQALLTAGKIAEAAAHCEAAGALAQANDLYEKVWDFVAATRCARLAGDLPRALDDALQARASQLIEEILAELRACSAELLLQGAKICEKRGAWEYAARCYDGTPARRQAADCYQRAGLELEAARCYELCDETKLAAETYRRIIDLATVATTNSSAQEDSTLEIARLRLGRLLLRHGRAGEALPFLQPVWLQGTANSLAAGRAVVAALAQLGLDHAVNFALRRIVQQHPLATLTVAGCLADADIQAATTNNQEAQTIAGRYLLGKLLGSGGMGRVYLATDVLTGQKVALKVFSPPGGAQGRDAFRRFAQEARIAGQLFHPHLVALTDFNEELGFMVLEFMAGGSLADRLQARMEPSVCRTILLQVLSGLAQAHQRGVIHRDIKPANIFFTDAGAAKLGDFGVAHLQDAGQTQTGAFIGTVAYMSPEQISGSAITIATDFYALGVTLFQLLTGQLPFQPPQLVEQHLQKPAPPPSRLVPELPRICDEVVLRCMAKQPQDRYDTIESLRQMIERFPTQTSPHPATSLPLPEQPRGRRAADDRFQVESIVFEDPTFQLTQARDNELGREVLIARLAPGPARAPRWALLAAAAAHGDEHLQRVFALRAESGQAIIAALEGAPVPFPPANPRLALHLCQEIGLALAALHSAGLAHGRIVPEAITQLEGSFLLALVPALEHPTPSSPAQDVQMLSRLVGLVPPADVTDGAALCNWAQQARTQQEKEQHAARYNQLLARALEPD